MSYSFSIDHARDHGTDAAIFLSSLIFWLDLNAVENRNVFDGVVWTYNTHKEYADRFPWLSSSQIKRILEKLKREEVIRIEHFDGFSRTSYITVTDTSLMSPEARKSLGLLPSGDIAKSIRRNRHIDLAISPDVYTDSTRYIPDKTSVKKTDVLFESIERLNGQLKLSHKQQEISGMEALEHFVDKFRERELALRPRNVNLTDQKKWSVRRKKWQLDTLKVIEKQGCKLQDLVVLHVKVLKDEGSGGFAYRDIMRSPGKYNSKNKHGDVYFDTLTNRYGGIK